MNALSIQIKSLQKYIESCADKADIIENSLPSAKETVSVQTSKEDTNSGKHNGNDAIANKMSESEVKNEVYPKDESGCSIM